MINLIINVLDNIITNIFDGSFYMTSSSKLIDLCTINLEQFYLDELVYMNLITLCEFHYNSSYSFMFSLWLKIMKL